MSPEDHPGGTSERRFGFADHRGNIYREIGEAEHEAIKAAANGPCRRYGGMVTAGLSPPSLLGSATVIKIGDELFAATARHLFDDFGYTNEVQVTWGDGDDRLQAVAIEEAREQDVAFIHLGRSDQAGGSFEALALEQIDARVAEPSHDDLMVIFGVPERSFFTVEELRTICCERWAQGVIELPRDRWPQLTPPLLSESHIVLHYSDRLALDEHGHARRAVYPKGFSGGGVWRLGVRAGAVWSPADARLIGIMESANLEEGRWIRATRIRHWLRLVLEEFSGLRSAICAALPDLETS